jgi:hypothetical protein
LVFSNLCERGGGGGEGRTDVINSTSWGLYRQPSRNFGFVSKSAGAAILTAAAAAAASKALVVLATLFSVGGNKNNIVIARQSVDGNDDGFYKYCVFPY